MRYRRYLIAVIVLLSAVTGLSASGTQFVQSHRTGEVIEKVVCKDPDYSYALYLPSSYTSKNRWPMLYLLDARGRALVPLERFREVAEQYGYIVASSYDTQSDGPIEPAMKAVRALWRDTHLRFQIDNRRVYMAGFSGEARLACLMADAAPGSVTGVVACGAGFSPTSPPRKGMRFSFFGLVGNTDFNHDELIKLDSTLDGLDVQHRIEVFDGGHEWPPPERCAEAIEWMELGAMRLNRRPGDEILVESLFSKRLDQAEAFEEAGRIYQAFHQYDSLARDFAGLHDIVGVGRKAALLRDSEDLQSFLEQREKRIERDEAYLKMAARTLAQLVPNDPAGLHNARNELKLSTLEKRARNTDDEDESLSARRTLESVFVQTAFYLPRELMERGDFGRAVLVLTIASEIRPENAYVWYSLARAQARAGNEGSAVKSLRRAVENGLSDIAQLKEDPDLESLQGRKDFLELLAEMAQ